MEMSCLKCCNIYSPGGAVIIGQLREKIVERDSISAWLFRGPLVARHCIMDPKVIMMEGFYSTVHNGH